MNFSRKSQAPFRLRLYPNDYLNPSYIRSLPQEKRPRESSYIFQD